MRLLIEDALADGGSPVTSVVGHSVRLAPLQAALINGTASHVLDCDKVIVELTDGRTVRATHDAGVAVRDHAEQGQRLASKFERLAVPVIGEGPARRVMQHLADFEQKRIADLMAACARAG